MRRQPKSLFLKRVAEVNSLCRKDAPLHLPCVLLCTEEQESNSSTSTSATTDALKSCPPPDLFTLHYTRFPVTGS